MHWTLRVPVGVLIAALGCLAAAFAGPVASGLSHAHLAGAPRYPTGDDLAPNRRNVGDSAPYRRPDCTVVVAGSTEGSDTALAVWRATLELSESAAGAKVFRVMPLVTFRNNGGASSDSAVTAAVNCSGWQVVFSEPIASVRRRTMARSAHWQDLRDSFIHQCYVQADGGWSSLFFYEQLADGQSYAVWYYMTTGGLTSTVDAAQRLTARVGPGPRRVVPALTPQGLVWLAGMGSGGEAMTPLYEPSAAGMEVSYLGAPLTLSSVVPLSALYGGVRYRTDPTW